MSSFAQESVMWLLRQLMGLVGSFLMSIGWAGIAVLFAGGVLVLTLGMKTFKLLNSPKGMGLSAAVLLAGAFWIWWTWPKAEVSPARPTVVAARPTGAASKPAPAILAEKSMPPAAEPSLTMATVVAEPKPGPPVLPEMILPLSLPMVAAGWFPAFVQPSLPRLGPIVEKAAAAKVPPRKPAKATKTLAVQSNPAPRPPHIAGGGVAAGNNLGPRPGGVQPARRPMATTMPGHANPSRRGGSPGYYDPWMDMPAFMPMPHMGGGFGGGMGHVPMGTPHHGGHN